jgi:hypothetical protein
VLRAEPARSSAAADVPGPTLAACRDFLDDAIRLTRQVRTKLAAAKRAAPTALPAERDLAADVLLHRQLRRRSLALVALVAAVMVAGVALLLAEAEPDRLVSAVVIVGAALVLAGLYTVLVDRGHARAALVVAAGGPSPRWTNCCRTSERYRRTRLRAAGAATAPRRRLPRRGQQGEDPKRPRGKADAPGRRARLRSHGRRRAPAKPTPCLFSAL